MNLLILDNFDSFTYNLVEYFSMEGIDPTVVTNDYSLDEINDIDPDLIAISPGPGHPKNPSDMGCTLDLIREYSETPILGVCLGHQALAYLDGGEISRDEEPVHGKSSRINHTGEDLYRGIPQGFHAGRYHSLIVSEAPESFEINAWSGDIVMGIKHRERPHYGVQYHPESVLTGVGRDILRNFIDLHS